MRMREGTSSCVCKAEEHKDKRWASSTPCGQTSKYAAAEAKNVKSESSGESGMTNTFILPWRKLAGCPTHVDKRVKVSLQTLVRLSLQPGQYSELGPVECFHVSVIHHPKGRHGAIEICLLSTSPPKMRRKTIDLMFWIEY